MANKNLNIDIYANLIVSDETAEKCCRLLEMWMADDVYRKVVCEINDEDHWVLRLVRRRENGEK